MILSSCNSKNNEINHQKAVNTSTQKFNIISTSELKSYRNTKSIWILEGFDFNNKCLLCDIKMYSVLLLDINDNNSQIIEFSSNEFSTFYIGNLKSKKLYSSYKRHENECKGSFELSNKIISFTINNKKFRYKFYRMLSDTNSKNNIQKFENFFLTNFIQTFKRKTRSELKEVLNEKIISIECNNDLNETNLIRSEKNNWSFKIINDSLLIYKIEIPKEKVLFPDLNEKLVFKFPWK
jgi:mRNA-degrading endonuclease YafQ of YafQ-DinJ toxin-antitoxin module